jgi:hypothetical protein
MGDFEGRVLADLSVLKVQMESVVGGMQPGRLSAVEDRVNRHELYMQRTRGFVAALGVIITLLNVVIDLKRH